MNTFIYGYGFFKRILPSGEVLPSLVNNILDVARLDVGRVFFDLSAILNELQEYKQYNTML